MAKSGLKHIDVGPELTKTEWESEDSHEVVHGTSFPGSPVERQLFYRDDEHKWYIYDGTGWVWLGGGSGGGDISAQAKRTSTLSIAHGTLTAVTWQAADWDTDSIWSVGAPTRLTCKTTGKYMVWYLIIFADNLNGTRLAHGRLNGTAYPLQFSVGMDTDGRWRCSVSGVLSLVANDYIEIVVYQNSGVALTISELCIAGMIKLV